MIRLIYLFVFLYLVSFENCISQDFNFDFNSSGKRVCLLSSEVDSANRHVKLIFLDSLANTIQPLIINRREIGTTLWTNIATVPAGIGNWIDTNVKLGEIWEYQVRRHNTWNYQSIDYDAIGYTLGALLNDNSGYKGQMILLLADDVASNLPSKINRLKKELTGDGWFVNEIIVPRTSNWDSGDEVVSIKDKIISLYNNAAIDDKPKALFILGHIALPRSGSTDVVAPDNHDVNKGARGCDAYYADIDGIFTDTATYNRDNIATDLATNYPNDFKWDQDFFPSDIEMAFGRIDFAGLTDINTPEMQLIENYLDRLSNYRNVSSGYDMGDKSAFYFGFNNSNDGSYRSLPNISMPNNVLQNYEGPNHNQWVQSNGPLKIYMQNMLVPEISDWQNYGMEATVFTSDQSYWGFGDVPQNWNYSRIRALLGVESKCLITLWTTTGLNIFHQAGSGEALGISMKTIMNHNATNQYLEKPPQNYDEQDWWNRTHFAFYGDPTLTLYQVAPPSNLSISDTNSNAVLHWELSPDSNITGYNIYESATDFGKYEKILSVSAKVNNCIIPNYQNGNWYMVKAIKIITSGCGQFYHSSIGQIIQGTINPSGVTVWQSFDKVLYPNPTNASITIEAALPIKDIEVYSMDRKVNCEYFFKDKHKIEISLSEHSGNIFFIKLRYTNGSIETYKVIKQND